MNGVISGAPRSGVHEAGAVGVRDHGLQDRRARPAVRAGPTGVAWVSTTLPDPSPSTIRITMVRGSGLVNSATTGTPNRPMRNVTATWKRSASSGGVRRRRREHLELGERVRVKPRAVPRVQPVGDDVARLARADQPGDGMEPGTVGPQRNDRLSVGDSPPTGPGAPRPAPRRRTPDTASSRIRVPRPAAGRAMGRSACRSRPCRSTGRRRGWAGSGPTCSAAVTPRHATISTRRPRCRPAVADAVAGGERVPVAARPALRPRSAPSMTAGCGVAVGGPLSTPLRCAEAPGTARFSPICDFRSASTLIATAPFSAGEPPQWPERPWTGTVCRAWPATPNRSATGWPPTIPSSPRAPSAPPADRCGCRRRPAPGRVRGGHGRPAAWSPGANRGQSLRHSTRSPTMRARAVSG